ncbi:MAG: PAS domain S-box protein [Chloroflexi bacterium]|nr:PAS domain S-box protein [Chloroflexota bacterium]
MHDAAEHYARTTARQITSGPSLPTEAAYSAIFAQVPDGILITDSAGRCRDANPAALELLGYEIEELLQLGVADVFASSAAGTEAASEAFRREGHWPRKLNLRRKGGSLVPVEARAFAVELPSGELFVSVIRDLTEQHGRDLAFQQAQALLEHRVDQRTVELSQANRRLRDAVAELSKANDRQMIQYAITRALASSATIGEAVTRLLQPMCEGLGWTLGEAWVVDFDRRTLRWSGMWHQPAVSPNGFESASRALHLGPEEGLAGRVWASGQICVIPDIAADPNLVRRSIFAEAGLQSAVAFPIRNRAEINGVMVFFSSEAKEPDAELIEMMIDIGNQIGQFAERKRIEEQLARLSHQNELILNSVGEGIYGLDPEGKTSFVNSAAANMLGYEIDELLGRNIHPIIHHTKPNGQSYPLEECPLFASLRDGAVHNVVGDVFWTKTGTSFPVEYMSSPLLEDGRIVGAVISFRDITSRRRAEAEQRRLFDQAVAAEAKFRGLLESAPDAIVIVDGDGRIVLANQQATVMFGYDRHELQGQPVELLVPERFRAAHVHHRDAYLANMRTQVMGVNHEQFARRKDGSEVPVEISLSPMNSDDGVLIITMVRDVTTQRDLERQKDEFLRDVSHDLRTPVSAIKASIGVVLANEPANMPAPLHRMLVNSDLAADRMVSLLDDLLELARLRGGRVQFQPRDCDLREPVRRVARAIEPLTPTRDQRLEIHLPPEPVQVLVDPERLERALLNLVSNAHKYGRDGGLIRVGLSAIDDEAVVAVTDDGPGIAPEDQERIFDQFFRSKAGAARRADGTGLGLTIARGLVELHGGSLSVTSRPGEGATFRIALPLRGVETKPRRAQPAEPHD